MYLCHFFILLCLLEYHFSLRERGREDGNKNQGSMSEKIDKYKIKKFVNRPTIEVTIEGFI